MDLGLEALTHASATGRDDHRPEFFRLAHSMDRERLHGTLKRDPGIRVHDELLSQLRELVRTLNPSIKYNTAELEVAALAHLQGTPPEEYGVWVYYPWNSRLVHLLDETEFALVRTDRNRNKITSEEQARLRQLKVGVVGLSVGQSICLTLALERSFGELRIADFDTLELSNLNRIRSGVHGMGNLKTVNVAREIAELDPFLKVTLYNQGLDRDNIDRFFTEGGPLDVVVDECDSVDVKIFLRQKARALRIPVVMDTSDRGMLDVERFDLEPDRPILHGLIDHLDPEDAAKAKTNEEKLPFVLPILNIDTLSKRMKASMLEIETSTVTWPQLASSVVLGGALGGDTVRRIALGQFTASGRWFVDLDELLVGDEAPTERSLPKAPVEIPGPLSEGEMISIAERLSVQADDHGAFTEQDARTLVEAACSAPSGGNSQPWQFLLHDGRLLVFMDPARSFSTIDPGLVYARLAMGASIENIRLISQGEGKALRIDIDPIPGEDRLIACISPTNRANNAGLAGDPLSACIALRCTNRKRGRSEPIAEADLRAMEQAVTSAIPEANVQFAVDPARIAEIGALCGEAERVRMLNPISHWDMFEREMRWTGEEAETKRDGVDVRTLELSLSDRTGINVAADPEAVAYLRQWGNGRGFEKMSRKLVAASAAVALISMPDLSRANALLGGRAVQRLWLQATGSAIAVQPVSAPIFMGIHERYDNTGIYSTEERRALARVYARLVELFKPEGAPLFMVRLDHADPPSVRSLRKPIKDLFFVHQHVTA